MLLSVCIVTYNHEQFIRQCIESVLAQKTDFQFEIRIGDDASPDGTAKVLSVLEQEHPGRLNVVYRQSNIGAERNFGDIVLGSKAQYVAFLEGDNFWTDPHKLQRQVDALRAKPEASFCFHRAKVCETLDDQVDRGTLPGDFPELAGVQEILAESNPVPLGSMVIRRALLDDMQSWVGGLKLGDWPICIILASLGPVLFLDQTMSVQREHSGGSWTALNPMQRELYICQMFLRLSQFIDAPTQARVDNILAEKFEWMGGLLSQGEGMEPGALDDLLESIGDEPLSRRLLLGVLGKTESLVEANEWHKQQLARLEGSQAPARSFWDVLLRR